MTRRVVAGIAGTRRNAAVALAVDGEITAFCEQERVTRVRRAGLPAGVMPVEALAVALHAAGGLSPADITSFAAAEVSVEPSDVVGTVHVDHHRAHAATAFYLSPFETAAVLVCDSHTERQTSVWTGTRDGLVAVDWPTSAQGMASIYTEAARLFGWPADSAHELEALARLGPAADGSRLDGLVRWTDRRLSASPDWPDVVRTWLGEPSADRLGHRAIVAAALQRHLGSLVLDLVRDVRAATSAPRLSLAGGLFYNTWFTTLIRQSGIFDDVFVPPNPGNAGTAIGAALEVGSDGRGSPCREVSPFLGPGYDAESIKRTLDNCKLSYEVVDEQEVIDLTASALVSGLLVGWFQGRMEWGHRALGNRSILANPLSPYTLDNLNVFLKHRERHRSYGVSVPEERAAEFFLGPPASRFMEYEYQPERPELFRQIMPGATATLRVQTIPDRPGDASVARFRRLHDRFGAITGVPVLINTSFNGFAEPMAMSPRDAIRMFFGTGLDLLVIDRFVVRK